MEFSSLGKSGLSISRIGFGCMSITRNTDKPADVVHAAIDGGINFFDTADLYEQGWNEEMLGKATRGKRHAIHIATKVGNRWREDGSGWDWYPRKDYILTAVEKSLRRLNTDYIDLYQLHGGTLEDNMEEVLECFMLLQQQGKIRHYGISSIRPNVIRKYTDGSPISSVMMQYSLLDRRPEEECLALLKTHNIGVLARGTLAKGLLAGKQPAAYLDFSAIQVAKIAGGLAALRPDQSPSATALQFVLAQPAVTSAIVGIRTMEQLAGALDVYHHPRLSSEEYDYLSELAPNKMYDEHR